VPPVVTDIADGVMLTEFTTGAETVTLAVPDFVVSAALIAGALYLILDMDVPFSGPIQISSAPLQRALVELQQ